MAPVNDPVTNLGAAGVFLGATGFLVALVGAGVFVLTGAGVLATGVGVGVGVLTSLGVGVGVGVDFLPPPKDRNT